MQNKPMNDKFHISFEAQQQLAHGVAAIQAGKYRRALEALESAYNLAPEHPEILANLATVERALGDNEKALRYNELALERASHNGLIRLNFALLQLATHRPSEALRTLESLLQTAPDAPAVHYHLGHAYLTTRLVPNHVERAEFHLRRSLALQPNNDAAYHALVEIMFQRKQYEQIVSLMEIRLAKHPFDQYAIALKLMAQRSLGNHEQAAMHDSPETWVRSYRMACAPSGFRAMDDFHQALLDHVAQHPDLLEVHTQATQNGRRVEDLLSGPMGPMQVLAEWLLTQLREYLDWMGSQPLPYPKNVLSQAMQLRGWGVLMHTGGYETSHLHPGGVLSAVYYPRLPSIVKDTPYQSGAPGYIGFGQPDSFFSIGYTPDAHFRQPQEGLLVIFPSYLWHHTVPFTSAEQRLSLAFDLQWIQKSGSS